MSMLYLLGAVLLFGVLYVILYAVLISIFGVVAIQLLKLALGIAISIALLWLGYKISDMIVNHFKK